MSIFLRSRETAPPPIKESDQYPALMNMIRGYFNQDYHVISEDSDEIVTVFKEENSTQHILNVIADIRKFLSTHGEDDPGLARIFERVFTPEANFHEWKGRTTREALLKVTEILSIHTAIDHKPT